MIFFLQHFIFFKPVIEFSFLQNLDFIKNGKTNIIKSILSINRKCPPRFFGKMI